MLALLSDLPDEFGPRSMPETATYRDPDGSSEAVATVESLMAQNGRLFGHDPVAAQAALA